MGTEQSEDEMAGKWHESSAKISKFRGGLSLELASKTVRAKNRQRDLEGLLHAHRGYDIDPTSS